MGNSGKRSAAPAAASKAAVVHKRKSIDKREPDCEIQGAIRVKKQKREPVKAEAVAKEARKKQPPPKKAESSSSEESSESEEEEKPTAPVKTTSANKYDSSESDSDDEPDKDVPAKSKAPAAATKKDDYSDNSDSDIVLENKDAVKDTPKPPKKESDSDVGSSEESFGNEPKRQAGMDEDEVSKVIYIGNLSISAKAEDVEKFFSSVGTAVRVRLPLDKDGQRRAFGYIEFAKTEHALKALGLNGQELLGNVVKLDIAHERCSRAPRISQAGYFGKESQGSNLSVYVKGLDKAQSPDAIRDSLQKYFSAKCGEISSVAVPVDHQTGVIKGWAYINFKDRSSVEKALLYNGSGVGGTNLHVAVATSKNYLGAGRRSGGRFGRSVGRYGGGSFGRSGGQRFEGRLSAGTDVSGKKTFDND